MTKNPGPAAAVISAFILLTSSFSHAAVWYVDKDNAGAEHGTSWATAYVTIQPAINASINGTGGEVRAHSGNRLAQHAI